MLTSVGVFGGLLAFEIGQLWIDEDRELMIFTDIAYEHALAHTDLRSG